MGVTSSTIYSSLLIGAAILVLLLLCQHSLLLLSGFLPLLFRGTGAKDDLGSLPNSRQEFICIFLRIKPPSR